MKLATATGLVICICAGSLFAQQAPLGKYTGSFILKTTRGDETIGIGLEITSAEDGKLKATAIRSGGTTTASRGCAGKYDLQGTFKDGAVDLGAEKGGAAGDCPMRLTLTQDGNKLKGKMGERDIELSK